MSSPRYIQFRKNIFQFFKNAAYAEKIKQKDPADKVLDHNKFNEHYPLKLHITLEREAYKKHEENVKSIIINYLSEGEIFSFKDVNYTEANANVERLQYRLTQNLSDNTRDKLNISLKRYERFLDGDQFTIFIPENYDANKILRMCQEIDQYLKDNKVIAGTVSDYALALTNFINARKPYLDDDPVRKDASYNDEDKETEVELRQRSHDEISKDELFKFLHERMEVGRKLQR